jgi:hypothetical protein
MFPTIIRALSLVLVLGSAACAGTAVSGTPADAEPVCGSESSTAEVLNSGCDASAAYVVTCSAGVENPGLEGRCNPPPVGELGITRELAGKAPVWCCK